VAVDLHARTGFQEKAAGRLLKGLPLVGTAIERPECREYEVGGEFDSRVTYTLTDRIKDDRAGGTDLSKGGGRDGRLVDGLGEKKSGVAVEGRVGNVPKLLSIEDEKVYSLTCRTETE